MSMINIIRQIDEYSRQVWLFTHFDNIIVLDSYYIESRATTRHKWVFPAQNLLEG